MYAGLSNGSRINDGRMVVVSFRKRRIRNSNRPVNSGLAMPLPHHAAALHRHWLRRQAIFLLLLTLHKLFIMQHFLIIIITIISGLHYFLCTGKWSGDFGVTLLVCIDHAMSPLRSAELFAPPPWDRLGGWNLIPHQARAASSIPNILTS